MDCEFFRKLVEVHLRGKLRWPRKKPFNEHWLSCDTCRRYAEREEVVWESRCVEGKERVENSPVARIAYTVLQEALKQQARQLRVEPAEDLLQAHSSADGRRELLLSVPGYITDALIARFKLMAGLDVHEDASVQQGLVRIRYESHDYSIRLTTAPSPAGEALTMEISESPQQPASNYPAP